MRNLCFYGLCAETLPRSPAPVVFYGFIPSIPLQIYGPNFLQISPVRLTLFQLQYLKGYTLKESDTIFMHSLPGGISARSQEHSLSKMNKEGA